MTTTPQDLIYIQSTATLRQGGSFPIQIKVLRRLAAFSLYLMLAEDGHEPMALPMKWLGMTNGYDDYSCEIEGKPPGLYWYWFEQDVCGDRVPFGKEEPWQLTVFDNGYETPGWYDSGVTYHIFVDRFHRAGPPPEPKQGRKFRLHGDWSDTPDLYPEGEQEQNWDFFGGNLRGIREKLPYLKSLGVTALYLSPVFEAASNHRYDTGDYMKIDPVAGNEEEFRVMCAEAQAMGIRVIMDCAFSHTGSDSRYFNARGLYDGTGAAQSKESPYYGWYRFGRWPDDYECWWGVRSLPQVNELNPGYMEYTLKSADSVVRHWLAAGASGFRLDVADELPREYVECLRAAVKETKPDALVIGEVWEDASTKSSYGERRRYFQGRELDGVMNYPAREAILQFIKGELAAGGLRDVLMRLHRNYPEPARRCMMNVLSTHDTARTINYFGAPPEAFVLTKPEKAARGLDKDEYERGRGLLQLASALQYMLPGSPCLYYGDEAGLTGFEDPLNRRCYPWGEEDGVLIEWYRALGSIRTELRDVFSGGELKVEPLGERAVRVERLTGARAVAAIVNAGAEQCRVPLPGKLVPLMGIALWKDRTAEIPGRSVFIYGVGEEIP